MNNIELPEEIRNAVELIDKWCQTNGYKEYQIGPICSRVYSTKLDNATKLLERCRNIGGIPYELYEDIQEFLN